MSESAYPMLPVAEALEIVLAQAAPLPAVGLPLEHCLGLVLAEDVTAPEPLPPFPASVKDGYAVVASDGPGVYPVIGRVAAGQVGDFTVRPGTVAYITTGAPLPSGADSVVMIEETELLPSSDGAPRVRISAQVEPGADVRPVGHDIAHGQQVLAAGTRLGPVEIGLLATVGADRARVHPRPRVAVLSTGDELVPPGAPLAPGQIRDSNRATLLAAISYFGGEPVDLGIGRDSREDLEAHIHRGLDEADMLLTSGGVSMGDLDLIKPILERAGTVHFGRLRMKPGKPLTFATAPGGEQKGDAGRRAARRLIFGLPGNPVSSLVTFCLLGVPAMRRMAGWRSPKLPRVHARLAEPLALDPHRPEYHRALVRWTPDDCDGGCFVATSTGSQASSRLLSMSHANALLELPAAAATLPAGAVVSALLVGDLP